MIILFKRQALMSRVVPMLQQLRLNYNTLKLQGSTGLPLKKNGSTSKTTGPRDSEQTTTSSSWTGLPKFGKRTQEQSLAEFPKLLRADGQNWKTKLSTTGDMCRTEPDMTKK